jgi:hypothetical protein
MRGGVAHENHLDTRQEEWPSYNGCRTGEAVSAWGGFRQDLHTPISNAFGSSNAGKMTL